MQGCRAGGDEWLESVDHAEGEQGAQAQLGGAGAGEGQPDEHGGGQHAVFGEHAQDPAVPRGQCGGEAVVLGGWLT